MGVAANDIPKNYLKVICPDLEDMCYVRDTLVVSDNASHDGVPTAEHISGDEWQIELTCERKDSTAVAGQFLTLSGGPGHMIAQTWGSGGKPDRLNFCFTMQLKFVKEITDRAVRLTIGQGHAFPRNNWWTGSPNLVAQKDDSQLYVLNYATSYCEQVFDISQEFETFSSKNVLKLKPWFS